MINLPCSEYHIFFQYGPTFSFPIKIRWFPINDKFVPPNNASPLVTPVPYDKSSNLYQCFRLHCSASVQQRHTIQQQLGSLNNNVQNYHKKKCHLPKSSSQNFYIFPWASVRSAPWMQIWFISLPTRPHHFRDSILRTKKSSFILAMNKLLIKENNTWSCRLFTHLTSPFLFICYTQPNTRPWCILMENFWYE